MIEFIHLFMKIYFNLILFALFLHSCNSSNIEVSPPKKYNDSVGQRTGLSYLGGNEVILEEYLDKFKTRSSYTSFTGYVVIRFIMNCKNETGRFRVESLANDFSLQKCPAGMQEDLLAIAKNLRGWQHAPSKDASFDYTKYINIKITNGKVIEILH